MSLCYTPKAVSCLEEIKYNINHCLELALSFPKMYITLQCFDLICSVGPLSMKLWIDFLCFSELNALR